MSPDWSQPNRLLSNRIRSWPSPDTSLFHTAGLPKMTVSASVKSAVGAADRPGMVFHWPRLRSGSLLPEFGIDGFTQLLVKRCRTLAFPSSTETPARTS